MKLTIASDLLYEEDYHYELKPTLNSASDIVRIKEPSPEDLYDDYEAVIKSDKSCIRA